MGVNVETAVKVVCGLCTLTTKLTFTSFSDTVRKLKFYDMTLGIVLYYRNTTD